MASISKLFDELDIDEDSDSQTVNGWTMTELSKIPDEGDEFESLGLKVEVLKTDGKRVENVRITDLRDSEEDDGDNKEQSESNQN